MSNSISLTNHLGTLSSYIKPSFTLSDKITQLFRAANSSNFLSSIASPQIQGLSKLQSHWLYTERYVNGIAPRPNNPHATYTEVQEQFRPGSPNPSFSVPLFKLPRDLCNVRIAQNADPKIVSKYVDNSHSHLAVYPQVLNENTEPHLAKIKNYMNHKITVAPTASSRSLFVLEKDSQLLPHCVKTHLPLRITRNMRGLNRAKIEHSITISDQIGRSIPSFNNPQFAYLPETLGVSIKGKNSDDSWGFLVRELIPHPFIPGSHNRLMIPLFALYSKDKMNPDKKPILCDLIEASGEDPKSFIQEKILFPILRVWAEVYQKTGIILESHGQNTLFEVDEKGMPCRVVNKISSALYVSKEGIEKQRFHSSSERIKSLFRKTKRRDTTNRMHLKCCF